MHNHTLGWTSNDGCNVFALGWLLVTPTGGFQPGGGIDDDLIPRRNRRKAIREAEELQLLMFIVAVIDQEDQ
jgi:hypothetical protein